MGSIADNVLKHVDPKAVTLGLVEGGIVAMTMAWVSMASIAIMLATGVLPGWALVLALMIWAVGNGLLLLLLMRYPGWEHRFTRYRIATDGIEIHHGVWWRTITNVPRSRIQHTDVTQGPIMRQLGLAKLVIHTAGTEDATVELEGLAHAVALEIRDFLIDGGADDGV